MSGPGDQWSAERVRVELEPVLVALQMLEDQLAESLCLANSNTELKTTIAAYEQPNLVVASDA